MLRFESLSAEKVCNGIRASMNTLNAVRDAFCLQLRVPRGLVNNSEITVGGLLDNGLLVLHDFREALRVTSSTLAHLYWFVFIRI